MQNSMIVMPAAFIAATVALSGAQAHAGHDHAKMAKAAALKCPVMGTAIPNPAKAQKVMLNNKPVYLCCQECPAAFKKEPAKFVKSAKDPITGKAFQVTAKSPRLDRNGDLFLFSSEKTRAQFQKRLGGLTTSPK